MIFFNQAVGMDPSYNLDTKKWHSGQAVQVHAGHGSHDDLDLSRYNKLLTNPCQPAPDRVDVDRMSPKDASDP